MCMHAATVITTANNNSSSAATPAKRAAAAVAAVAADVMSSMSDSDLQLLAAYMVHTRTAGRTKTLQL
jgi:hypothetical protein